MAADQWLQLDPWRDLEGLPQRAAAELNMPVSTIGPELEARLRDGRIASRIMPSRVWPALSSLDRHGGPPRPSWPPTTTAATIEENGGWATVDWSAGTIEGLPIEVHWPNVKKMISDLREQPVPPRRLAPPAIKREAVEATMRAQIKSGELTPESLGRLKRKQLPALFGVGFQTCDEARKRVLQSFEMGKLERPTPTSARPEPTGRPTK